MAWTWRLESADGVAREPSPPAHSSQSDAESWLGEHWRELHEQGVAQVVLIDGGEAVYGPMPLADA